MEVKFLVLVAVALAAIILLVIVGRWVDRSFGRRVVVSVVIVMGGALVLQLKFPELVSRIVG